MSQIKTTQEKVDTQWWTARHTVLRLVNFKNFHCKGSNYKMLYPISPYYKKSFYFMACTSLASCFDLKVEGTRERKAFPIDPGWKAKIGHLTLRTQQAQWVGRVRGRAGCSLCPWKALIGESQQSSWLLGCTQNLCPCYSAAAPQPMPVTPGEVTMKSWVTTKEFEVN